ncbi:MAG TPA: hypothetical protein VLM89_16810 [Phycisphaerae bacterium]|nr:hypothetical protein [Phycisphaerae bacterium]
MIAVRWEIELGAAKPGMARASGYWVVVLCLLAGMGCSQSKKPLGGWAAITPNTAIAVAPALNFSGSADFDPVKVADILASELSQVPGVAVIGVNRVLAILAEQGTGRIESPEHALAICDRLGADAIVVFAVTEYDAHTPVVGIVAQMYGRETEERSFDPVATSQAARPFPVTGDRQSSRPWAQSQRTFNARHDVVQEAVKAYAESRNATDGPYGWKRYVASQEWYLRFCSHTVCRDLLEQSGRLPVSAVAAGGE